MLMNHVSLCYLTLKVLLKGTSCKLAQQGELDQSFGSAD